MFSNKVRWKQTLYQSCRSRRDRQLYSWWLFHLKSFVVLKLCFKFSQFKIQICETTSNGETSKTKVVDLDKNYNFIVNDFHLNLFKVLNIHLKILRGKCICTLSTSHFGLEWLRELRMRVQVSCSNNTSSD